MSRKKEKKTRFGSYTRVDGCLDRHEGVSGSEKLHLCLNLRCVANHAFEALHLKDTEAVDQTDGEDHFKLGECLETAEDDVHSG